MGKRKRPEWVWAWEHPKHRKPRIIDEASLTKQLKQWRSDTYGKTKTKEDEKRLKRIMKEWARLEIKTPIADILKR